MGFYSKPENKYGPLNKFQEDDKVLKGFIWKPKDRPVSKESIIPSYNKKKEAAEKKKTGTQAPAGKTKNGKAPLKKPGDSKAAKDSTQNVSPGKFPGLKTGKDSTLKLDTAKISMPKPAKDTAKTKPPVVNSPGVKQVE